MNENENTAKLMDLWDASNAVLRGKFIAVNTDIGKEDSSQINNLNFHHKKLEKEEKTKPKASRRK